MAKEEKEQKKISPVAEENENKETEALEEGHVVTPVEEEEIVKTVPKASIDVAAWNPKTIMGKKVKTGEIADIDQVLNSDKKLLEAEIVDVLIPTLESDLLLIGQSKGKFGGGQRRVFRQTQKKTKEGNKPSFATCAVVGDRKGHVGIGYGKSRETVPAREKAIRKAKINLIKIRRGCGSWQCNCKEPHSIPFAVEGKCGSVKVMLKPAPKGTGLCAGSEIAKILKLAGVKDVWSQTSGKTTSRINLTSAVVEALKKLTSMKVQERYKEKLNIVE
ncbi:MAG: 30S ribosomal protein S5 [Nanoarchaeota archaeon]|nr:30S ribosomal protein S5 [Nanoarchaeota archaeon]